MLHKRESDDNPWCTLASGGNLVDSARPSEALVFGNKVRTSWVGNGIKWQLEKISNMLWNRNHKGL